MAAPAPVVSILISTYNRSGMLRRAIDSVLMQDFGDFEIVVIDDCSSDDTAQVVASIADPRIRYIRNDTNIGSRLGDRAHVQRFVYELMRGRYFVYLCDDDYWLLPDLLHRQVIIFQSHNDVSFVMGNQLSHVLTTPDSYLGGCEEQPSTLTLDNIGAYFDLSSLTCKSPHLSFFPRLFSKSFMTGDEFLTEFATEPTTKNRIVGATLYSRSHFMRAGAMKTDGSKWQAGYEFLMGPACVGNVGYIDDPCIVTEIRAANASFQRTQVEHYLDSIKSIEIAFETPLADPMLIDRRRFFRDVKAETIRNLSHAFQTNSLTILREGSLGLCSEENIRCPVTPRHVAAVLLRNRVLPGAALVKSCRDYLSYRPAHSRSWLFIERRLSYLLSHERLTGSNALRAMWRRLPQRLQQAVRSFVGRTSTLPSRRQMKSTKYSDKILPNQEFFRHLYHDDAAFEDALHTLMSSYSNAFSASRFDLVKPENIDFEEMSTPPWQIALFGAMIKLTGARTVLEIGSFIGHTAMQFARMVGERGHVTTIEMGKDFAALARENFRRNRFLDHITLLEGDAGKVLASLAPKSFDLIFVDGSKQDYLEYTLKARELLTDRGMIIIDDVFFHGDALNVAPGTDKGKGCRALLDHFRNDSGIERLLLPIANGILILYKADQANGCPS